MIFLRAFFKTREKKAFVSLNDFFAVFFNFFRFREFFVSFSNDFRSFSRRFFVSSSNDFRKSFSIRRFAYVSLSSFFFRRFLEAFQKRFHVSFNFSIKERECETFFELLKNSSTSVKDTEFFSILIQFFFSNR